MSDVSTPRSAGLSLVASGQDCRTQKIARHETRSFVCSATRPRSARVERRATIDEQSSNVGTSFPIRSSMRKALTAARAISSGASSGPSRSMLSALEKHLRIGSKIASPLAPSKSGQDKALLRMAMIVERMSGSGESPSSLSVSTSTVSSVAPRSTAVVSNITRSAGHSRATLFRNLNGSDHAASREPDEEASCVRPNGDGLRCPVRAWSALLHMSWSSARVVSVSSTSRLSWRPGAWLWRSW
mmetsp:Transcript_47074/g.112193  ORF Transcript_47074/g.112193 Transcript_47074/m.112193 type:complete len:243 (-) Transcript_47074:103-831(-)